MSGHPEEKPTDIEKPEPSPTENVTGKPLPLPVKTGNRPVSQETLTAAWNEFANTVKTEDTRLFSILIDHQPVLADETKIIFHISNPLQNEPLQKIQPRLLQHLKTTMDNENTEIEIVLTENNETAKAYTIEDKFVQMSRKNPSLLTFKQQFSLDIL